MPIAKKDNDLTEVADLAYIQFRKAQAQLLDSKRFGIHVTDYNKPCMRNVAYLLMLGGDSNFMDTETMGRFYTGQIVHKHSNLQGIANEMSFCYDIPNDKPIKLDKDGIPEGLEYDKKTKAPIGINGRPFIDFVFGSLDDLITHTRLGNVIVDKKTYEFKGYEPKKAYDHHVEQVEMYRLMLNKCKKLDAQYGCNLYIEKGGSRIWRFAYRLSGIDLILKKLQLKYETLKLWHDTGELPDRNITWLCEGYCPVAKRCFSDSP